MYWDFMAVLLCFFAPQNWGLGTKSSMDLCRERDLALRVLTTWQKKPSQTAEPPQRDIAEERYGWCDTRCRSYRVWYRWRPKGIQWGKKWKKVFFVLREAVWLSYHSVFKIEETSKLWPKAQESFAKKVRPCKERRTFYICYVVNGWLFFSFGTFFGKKRAKRLKIPDGKGVFFQDNSTVLSQHQHIQIPGFPDFCNLPVLKANG